MTGDAVEFIVLTTTKVGENALVVHTLSREWGRRGFLVRSAKKTGTTLFLPLNILEADVVENSKSELWTLKNITLKDALEGIRGNLKKNTMTLFLSEVLFRTVRDGANEDGLYEWCVGSILTLNALEADFANFPVRFLLELAGALGFRPTFDDIAPFAGEHLNQMKALTAASFSESLLLPLNGSTRNALCEELLQYLSYHTEANIQVKSLAVLRELYR
ncbi:MAG: DNA repair protein RecO C-terminal domain-containing protein [Bacteroidales bacterium]|jgi:DNA repair protein RecO (recombination protein O)|nr:DNA repair protein RecO C-terminal domain-containing protein [Bacteroidales bacterium]